MENAIGAQKHARKKITIGILLLELYIFTFYTAQDIIIPSLLNTVCLYLFVVWGCATFIFDSKAKISRFTVWYAVFAALSFLSLTYSPEPILPLGSSMYRVLVTLALTFCMQLFITDEVMFHRVLCTYAASSAALVLLLMVTGNMFTSDGIRLGQELVGNANVFSGMMMVALMYEIWLFLHMKTTITVKVFLLAGMALNMLALLLSGGRKAVIASILFLYISLILRRDAHGRRKIITYTVVIGALVAGLFYAMITIPDLYDAVGWRMVGLLNAVTGEGATDVSTLTRANLRALAFREWWNSPIIGHGFDSYKYLNVQVYGRFYYSHCNYTELLYNGGIIAFVAYYYMPFRLLKGAFSDKTAPSKYRDFAIATVLSMLAYDYGAVDYDAVLVISMFMMAAIGLSLGKKDSEAQAFLKQRQANARIRM